MCESFFGLFPASDDTGQRRAICVTPVVNSRHRPLDRHRCYTLGPEYEYHDNGTHTGVGYVANNVVRLTPNDLDKLANVIDTATQTGANEVKNVQFLLRDQQAIRAQALREAVLAAKGDARALAGALDFKITRIVSVDDNATPERFPELGGMFKRSVPESAQTPMWCPGQLTLRQP